MVERDEFTPRRIRISFTRRSLIDITKRGVSRGRTENQLRGRMIIVYRLEVVTVTEHDSIVISKLLDVNSYELKLQLQL